MNPNICMGAVSSFAHHFFKYKSPRVVVMRNLRIGVTYRIVQVLLLIYVIGYVFVHTKSYQDFDVGDSSVVTKVKGVLERNHYGHLEVWDNNDFVVPSQETSAFFIATNLLLTRNQSQGVCPEDVFVGTKTIACRADDDCAMGKPTLYGNGIATGKCNRQTGTCEIRGWCPTEIDVPPSTPVFKGFESITVLVKNHIAFPKFHVKRYDPHENPRCPVFSVTDIVMHAGSSFEEMAEKGGIIGFNIQWNCDLDLGEEACLPEYSFRRLDDPGDKLAKGWNFRHPTYHYDANGVIRRDLVKLWGIRFVFLVDARAGKFSLVNFVMHLGSSVGLFGIAAIICELMLFTICRSSPELKDQKFTELDQVKRRRRSTLSEGSSVALLRLSTTRLDTIQVVGNSRGGHVVKVLPVERNKANPVAFESVTTYADEDLHWV